MKKYLIIVACGLIVLLILSYGILTISKSRSFQFFGGLVERVDTSQKVIALTFDDAPGKETGEILKELAGLGIKTTFFAVGYGVEKNLDNVSWIVTEGHELGNHTYSHNRMVFKSPGFIKNEIERTDSLIRKAEYNGEIQFRPPNGKKLLLLPWYLKQHGRITIMWDIEPNTYPEVNKSARTIADYTIKNAKPGSIILLHPYGAVNANTRAAIPRIVKTLQGQGYRFVTISELLTHQKSK